MFEAAPYAGGHTVTTRVDTPDGPLPVDAGFIVFNPPNYPNFVRLLEELGVGSQPAPMSLSFRSDRTGFEFAGPEWGALFAQRRNLFRLAHYRFLAQILRFHRVGRRAIAEGFEGSLGDFLAASRLEGALAEQYLIPLTSAIWSTDPRRILEAPALFLLRFLDHHRLLGLRERPVWRVIRGGSQVYVDQMTLPFRDRIHLETPVRRLRRRKGGVEVVTDRGPALFDQVVVATHSDQALRMLEAPTPVEGEVLGAIRYQRNPAILHTDPSVLPRSRRAWASWNYRTPGDPGRPVVVTYNMTLLQSLPTKTPYLVSLNQEDEVAAASVIARFPFEHPLYDRAAVSAQARLPEISGVDRIHYCGAWCGHGFHEDGVVSGLRAARALGVAA